MDKDDILLILKQYNSIFVTNEVDPGFYLIKDLQEAVHLFGDHKGTLQIQYDDISIKTKINLPVLDHFLERSDLMKKPF